MKDCHDNEKWGKVSFSPAYSFWVVGKGWCVVDLNEAEKELNFKVNKLNECDTVLFFDNGEVTQISVESIDITDEWQDMYPCGKVLREYHNGGKERYLTTQHERDENTGLDYRGARYYDSDVARFLSLDPLAAEFPNWSDYNYVQSNPTLFTDPTGMAPTDWVKPAGSDQWSFDKSVNSQADATRIYGEGTEYKEPGDTYTSVQGEVRLKENGAWGFVSDETIPNAGISPFLWAQVDNTSVFGRPVLSTQSAGYKMTFPNEVRNTFGSTESWRTIESMAHFVASDLMLMVVTDGILSTSTRFSSLSSGLKSTSITKGLSYAEKLDNTVVSYSMKGLVGRAPKGGIRLAKGKFYKGGQFIPGEILNYGREIVSVPEAISPLNGLLRPGPTRVLNISNYQRAKMIVTGSSLIFNYQLNGEKYGTKN